MQHGGSTVSLERFITKSYHLGLQRSSIYREDESHAFFRSWLFSFANIFTLYYFSATVPTDCFGTRSLATPSWMQMHLLSPGHINTHLALQTNIRKTDLHKYLQVLQIPTQLQHFKDSMQ